jgi:hypothetical protein
MVIGQLQFHPSCRRTLERLTWPATWWQLPLWCRCGLCLQVASFHLQGTVQERGSVRGCFLPKLDTLALQPPLLCDDRRLLRDHALSTSGILLAESLTGSKQAA